MQDSENGLTSLSARDDRSKNVTLHGNTEGERNNIQEELHRISLEPS